MSIAAIPAIGIDFFINANGDTYFANAALAVIALGIAVRVCDLERNTNLNRSVRTSWLEVVLSAIAVMFISSPILSRLPPSLARQLSLIFAVVALCGLGAHLVVYSRTNQKLRLRLATSVIVFASLTLGIFGRVSQVGELSQRAEFPTSTELLVMNRIHEVTTIDAVIATNFGFCRETNCFRNDYRRLFLPALAQRQPYPLVPNRVLTAEFANQDSLSRVLAFVDSPTTPTMNTLVNAGVTHFLLDTTSASQSVTLQIGSVGRVIFRVSNFIFVDLSSK